MVVGSDMELEGNPSGAFEIWVSQIGTGGDLAYLDGYSSRWRSCMCNAKELQGKKRIQFPLLMKHVMGPGKEEKGYNYH